MHITGTHINYYRLCRRKLWLFAHGIQMEQNSDLVKDGKVIEKESYLQRRDHYTQIDLSIDFQGIILTGKIDYFDPKNNIVHETKRSNKVEDAHIWQVKFYLWLMVLNSIGEKDKIKGKIEYPKLRMTETVEITEGDKNYLGETVLEIIRLVESDVCPPEIHAKICKSCSYYDFCYVNE